MRLRVRRVKDSESVLGGIGLVVLYFLTLATLVVLFLLVAYIVIHFIMKYW
jgi:hypothetical protein